MIDHDVHVYQLIEMQLLVLYVLSMQSDYVGRMYLLQIPVIVKSENFLIDNINSSNLH